MLKCENSTYHKHWSFYAITQPTNPTITNEHQQEPTINLSIVSLYIQSLTKWTTNNLWILASNGNLQASNRESVPFRDLVHHSVPFCRIDPT